MWLVIEMRQPPNLRPNQVRYHGLRQFTRIAGASYFWDPYTVNAYFKNRFNREKLSSLSSESPVAPTF
ncbi:hypothetical protein LAD77_00260 [Klebsiella pneumoniae]|nr:hypothetical protein [Klebsiella pneumoniae]